MAKKTSPVNNPARKRYAAKAAPKAKSNPAAVTPKAAKPGKPPKAVKPAPAAKPAAAGRAATKSARPRGGPPRQGNMEVTAPARCRGAGLAFPLAGVACGAEGETDLRRLLAAIPADSPFAFLVAREGDPGLAAAWLERLRGHVRLPLQAVTDGLRLRPGHVYIPPPGTEPFLDGGLARLRPRQGEGQAQNADAFFRGLASASGPWTAGVLLAGATGGSLGLEDLKASGGITFAQSGRDREADDHAAGALATAWVDFVLKPEDIARELERLGRYFQARSSFPSDLAASTLAGEPGFKEIFALLRASTGGDFTGYKRTTVKRRILRRMVLRKCESLDEYVAFLKERPEELQALYQDILIKVTAFFRDPDAFVTLKRKVFPAILAHRGPESPIRIWVPGCSTGEEVYSIAICLLESLGDMATNTPVQIFATDISGEAIQKAQAGLYPETISMDVTPDRLRRFFVKAGNQYQISKLIWDMCIFARQNVVQDHPFSKLDLISCRNLLIYLDPHLQKKVFPAFHYALKPNGFLMLGTSETIGGFTDLFALLDKKNKIYAKKLAPSRPNLEFSGPRFRMGKTEAPKTLPGQAWTGMDVQKEADRVVLSQFSPPGVVVNGDMDILQFRGQTGPYLEPAPGQASLHLLKMVRPPLLLELRKTLDLARGSKQRMRSKPVPMERSDHTGLVSVDVVPLHSASSLEPYFLVLFHEERGPSGKERGAAGKAGRDPQSRRPQAMVTRLKKELEATKEYLQSIIEDQEPTNEELKSANEEILSSNEELQSTNEELETAKEELQSTNEELTTLNEDLQNRNLELSQANNDISNLLSSVNVPIVMLGNDLRIRRFTPMAEKVLKLIPADVGRPLGDIKTNLELPDLDQALGNVIETGAVQEREVQDKSGHWYSMRLRPYKTPDNKIEGVLMVLIDIDSLKSSLGQLREARTYAEAIVNTVRIPLCVLDAELKVRTANQAFREYFRVPAPAPGQGVDAYFTLGGGENCVPGLLPLLRETLPQGRGIRDRELECDLPHLGPRQLLVNIRPLQSEGEDHKMVLVSLEDITERKRAEEEIHRLNRELGNRIEALTASNSRLQSEILERRKAEDSLQETLAEREAFAYSVSHDLRAPLRAMQGLAEALVDDYGSRLDEPGLEYARRIITSAGRMDRLIQDLLAYSRMGQVELKLAPLALEPLVEEVLEQLDKEIREAGAKVEVRRPLPAVIGHGPTLGQVFLNLAQNALKFVAPGQTPNILVRAEARGALARVWVEDAGIGIAPEHHRRIFRVFERLHGVEAYPGTGIGLAIVRKGMERMGGATGVESEPGKGSSFWIELPMAGQGDGQERE